MKNHLIEKKEENVQQKRVKKAWSQPELHFIARGYVEGGNVLATREEGKAPTPTHYYVRLPGGTIGRVHASDYPDFVHS